MNSSHRRIAAFTLVEMLVGASVASVIMGGLMVATIALQRSFSASDRMAAAQSDLARVADYMAKDIRNATSVSTPGTSGVLLTLTTAEFTSSVSPTLGRTGATYGSSPITIRYLKSDRRILREVTRGPAGATVVSSTWIAD